jgi:hypothetical protein
MSAGRILNLDDVARGLGWFSVALGLAEMLAPGQVARTIGLGRKRKLFRLYGIRETAVGIGLLLSGERAPWLLARVGGDMLDIVTLRRALRRPNPRLGVARSAMASVLLITALDVLSGVLLSMERRRRQPVRDYSDRKGIRTA